MAFHPKRQPDVISKIKEGFLMENGPQSDEDEGEGALDPLALVESPRGPEYGLTLMDEDTSMEVAADPTEGDALCELAKSRANSSDMFDTLLQETAQELAFLKESRRLQYYAKGNFSSISEKRLKGLKTFAELASLKNKEIREILGGGAVDFKSESYKHVMEYLLKLVRKSLTESGAPKDLQKTFFARLQKELIGYEDNAQRIYSGVSVDQVMHGEAGGSK